MDAKSTCEIPSGAKPDPRHRALYEATVRRHLEELRGAALRLTRSRAEADDLVQEAVLRAWSFWDRFEPGTNGRAWLHRILVNSFINGWRRQRREREILAEVCGDATRRAYWTDAPREDERDDGLSDEIHEALAALPPEFRAVLERIDLDEQSYREVAEALGCPIGTVMSRLHRARRALRNKLRGYAATEGVVAEAA